MGRPGKVGAKNRVGRKLGIPMSNKKHVHRYYRIDLGFGKVWACALPDCNHHMPEHYASLLKGKRSICWECGETMILHEFNMNMERPVCDNCRLGTNILEKLS
jgi:hypothetical protein